MAGNFHHHISGPDVSTIPCKLVFGVPDLFDEKQRQLPLYRQLHRYPFATMRAWRLCQRGLFASVVMSPVPISSDSAM